MAALDPVRMTPLELARLKPYVVDPLIYDSSRVIPALIPPTNGRFTALGLCQFYSALAGGLLLSQQMLEEVAIPASTDCSLDTLFLTAGSSRTWGLGFQLFRCRFIPPGMENESSRYHDSNSKESDTTKESIIYGIGHGDLGGSVGMCFPSLDLSICIMLNDIMTGPEASFKILKFVLSQFGLTPAWNVPLNMSNVLNVMSGKVSRKNL